MRSGFKTLIFQTLLLLAPISAFAQSGCERMVLQEPARASKLNESQPELVWVGDPQGSYRLQVAVILPEGRIVDSFDALVIGNRWKFTRPIAVPYAAIKAIVSSNCPSLSVQDLHAERPYFFIDTRQICVLPPQSLKQTANGIQWEAQPNASNYIIQIFELATLEGKLANIGLVGRYESSTSSWALPADLVKKLNSASSAASAWAASVQAQCTTQLSRPQAVTISVPK